MDKDGKYRMKEFLAYLSSRIIVLVLLVVLLIFNVYDRLYEK